jgi:hypothetical protein
MLHDEIEKVAGRNHRLLRLIVVVLAIIEVIRKVTGCAFLAIYELDWRLSSSHASYQIFCTLKRGSVCCIRMSLHHCSIVGLVSSFTNLLYFPPDLSPLHPSHTAGLFVDHQFRVKRRPRQPQRLPNADFVLQPGGCCEHLKPRIGWCLEPWVGAVVRAAYF